MVGYLAYSLAGHDKGEIFYIINEDRDYVYVVDGRLRLVDKPKRKNKKHIQIIRNFNPMTDVEFVTNEEIKYLINSYSKGI